MARTPPEGAAVENTTQQSTIDERDVTAATDALRLASFTQRFIRTDGNAPDPEWKVDGGRSISEHVRDQATAFKNEIATVSPQQFRGGVFEKFASNVWLTAAHSHLGDAITVIPRDLLHVYGPDRDNTKDWTRYFRYAWTDKGPNAIIYVSNDDIIQRGKLGCNSYAYSGQSSYALVGAGMFFRPQYGDAKLSIRPLVQWMTNASFTGTDPVAASASASLGIYVESWDQSGGGHYVDRDLWIPVWSQNTNSYMSNATDGGSAGPSDGLAVDMLGVAHRKYAIFVYAWLETTVGAQQQTNELRFVTIDIDATVPYVVVEEQPL
jgi:hypothetical protein